MIPFWIQYFSQRQLWSHTSFDPIFQPMDEVDVASRKQVEELSVDSILRQLSQSIDQCLGINTCQTTSATSPVKRYSQTPRQTGRETEPEIKRQVDRKRHKQKWNHSEYFSYMTPVQHEPNNKDKLQYLSTNRTEHHLDASKPAVLEAKRYSGRDALSRGRFAWISSYTRWLTSVTPRCRYKNCNRKCSPCSTSTLSNVNNICISKYIYTCVYVIYLYIY